MVAVFMSGGALAGLVTKAAIGGVGIAAMGTAVAVPMVSIGTGLGLVMYGAYRLGKQKYERNAL